MENMAKTSHFSSLTLPDFAVDYTFRCMRGTQADHHESHLWPCWVWWHHPKSSAHDHLGWLRMIWSWMIKNIIQQISNQYMIIMTYGSPSYARLLMNTATIEYDRMILFIAFHFTCGDLPLACQNDPICHLKTRGRCLHVPSWSLRRHEELEKPCHMVHPRSSRLLLRHVKIIQTSTQ